jgi:hypothetical protein
MSQRQCRDQHRVRSHGEAVFENDAYLQQITYILDDYCIDPLLLWEGDHYDGSMCTGIQAAPSLPGDNGDAIPIYWISSGGNVNGGTVTIFKLSSRQILRWLIDDIADQDIHTVTSFSIVRSVWGTSIL